MKIKIMIDSNVLIYFLMGKEIDEIKQLFLNKNKYKFVITTRIIDEVVFKLMVINSGKKLKQLKKDKELLKKQIFIFEVIKDFLKDFEFKVYEIKEKHYWKMENIIKEFGLLGNDALTITIMKENNLKYIATVDKDFKKIPFIINILNQ
jgi:predicted nucleic acid-binding protein